MVAHHVGWAFQFVTLRRHPRYTNLWGYVQYSQRLESRDDLDRWAPTFLAGQFGEVVLLGFAGPGASQDNTMVIEQIRAYIGRDTEGREIFQRAYQQAMDIVQGRVASVRAVSGALQQRETLSSDEVTGLILPASDPES